MAQLLHANLFEVGFGERTTLLKLRESVNEECVIAFAIEADVFQKLFEIKPWFVKGQDNRLKALTRRCVCC